MRLAPADRAFYLPLATSLLPNFLILAASIVLLGATGPIFVAYLASLVLVWRSLGLRFVDQNCLAVAHPGITRCWRVTVIHSHHDPSGRSGDREVKIGRKYFCVGCYALALGTSLSLLLPTFYLIGVIGMETLLVLLALAPVCFVPTIRRLMTTRATSAFGRFVSYGLLPIGTWIVLIGADAAFHHWFLNALLLGLVVIGWNAGGLYLLRNGKRSGA